MLRMKFFARCALVVVLLVVSVGVASATYSSYYDAWVTVGTAGKSELGTLQIRDSQSTCNDSDITYFRIDGANFQSVTSASLVLTVAGTRIGIAAAAPWTVLSLYGVPDITQATLDGTTAPVTNNPPLTPLQSINLVGDTGGSLTTGTKLTFGGSNPALLDYIKNQTTVAGSDGIVTLALSFSGGCATTTTMTIYSSRWTANSSYQPALAIEGTKKDPNAVEVSTASAQQNNSWPLYAGLAAVALFVVAGVVISRRRTA
jgi:hypothetical protein